jgi:hypothetical protein
MRVTSGDCSYARCLAYPLMTWGTATDLSPSTPNSRSV